MEENTTSGHPNNAASNTTTPTPKTPLITAPKKANWLLWGCLILAAGACAAVLYYTWFPARTMFFADCSDTLYWANASYESGRLFSREFYYATLQPFGGQLLMLPFIALFGFGLKAHLAGMVVFALLFMAALWFFCSAFDLSLPQKLGLFTGILLLLCTSFKLRELMWEHVIYYSLAILFALLLMGLCFRLMDLIPAMGTPAQKGKGIALLALMVVLSIGIGTDGMQVLVLCTAPLLLALVAERFFDARSRLLGRKNVMALLLTGGIALGTAGGLVLLRLLSTGIRTSYTEQHMVFSPSAEWGEHILALPDFWARLLGFNSHNAENILSLGGLTELLRLFGALLLVVLPLVAAVNYATIRSRKFRILLWFHGFLCGILLLSHIVGSTANANWRFTPAVFSAAAVSLLYLLHLWETRSTKRITALLAGALALLCAVNVGAMLAVPVRNGQNQPMYALIHTLEENGLSYGFADFQVSQPITVLSDSRVKARYVYLDEAGAKPFPYQTEMHWYDDVPGQERYFLITDAGQYDAMKAHAGWQPLADILEERITSGPWEILVFTQNPIQ